MKPWCLLKLVQYCKILAGFKIISFYGTICTMFSLGCDNWRRKCWKWGLKITPAWRTTALNIKCLKFFKRFFNLVFDLLLITTEGNRDKSENILLNWEHRNSVISKTLDDAYSMLLSSTFQASVQLRINFFGLEPAGD